ncbi:hypothetical protein H114_03486 [Streptomyces gancidicus BKS 13-15]|uniref:Cyanobacterial TRADD-N associated 2 transmembrane domain-containing protein n=1 Tax=Streptomyces gancidicus BKS 13-15 TaxID=1284664 RepID=M3C2G9_STREZ|nr:hypothetical protein H114_03486 [Streptomyces gancidicus BKS 13-15]
MFVAEVFALTWMRSAGARWEELLTPIAICLGTAIFISGQLFFRESPEISEGRERVREAERDVEGALRGNQAIANTGTMRVRLVPAPAAGDAGEPQREEDAAALEERRDLALSRLWRLTQARLDLYHTIATTQARRSFVSAQFSMVAGFVMLTAFVVLALNVSNTSGAIVAGGLGAVSAALAGFISKTFVKSQQTAAEHLKAYFDQPLEFSRYLAAERLLSDADLPEEKRAEVVAALVQTVAAGPAGPALVDTRALLEQVLPGVPGQR